MRRTISAMVGKGSANHNSRRFIAENVDGSRTRYNISFIDEPINRVYHELFDEALARYNAKQKRKDRIIPDYYEKIRLSRQEKPFHEIILQIGDKSNMASGTENGELAKEVLDEYFKGFTARNPNLRVFSAHIHMDEATPHIHIDFVPFTTGSKRGLDTRVSLKQALAAQGFTGGTRGDTEWAQWVASEKRELAAVMERYGIEWEQKGTHEKHLSVLDFKKQEREKELNALEAELAEKQGELSEVQHRLESADTAEEKLEGLEYKLSRDEDYAVPEPPKLMSAKTYRERFVVPLVDRLKQLVRAVLVSCVKAWDRIALLRGENEELENENRRLEKRLASLEEKNDDLHKQTRDYALLRRVFGDEYVDNLVAEAREKQQNYEQNRKENHYEHQH
ncbi:MAG: plasmid recombination protein [Eubacteriales bacterium]|nr:plasmid recombination protein [Eubacteriales bacterium]